MFKLKIVAYLLILSIILCSCTIKTKTSNEEIQQAVQEQGEQKNHYKISLQYDREKRKAQGHETINFINQNMTELYEIVLHLYPNAYKTQKTVPIMGKMKDNFPQGFNPGKIEISDVRINREEAEYQVDNTIMVIKLQSPLKSGKSLAIDMDFSLQLPSGTARFGTYKGVSQFVYWYPILAVYDKGWQKRPYYTIGESNYSQTADYDVTITLPKEEIIASTGVLLKEDSTQESPQKTVHIKAKDVRDFVWVSSKDYEVKSTTSDGIRINSYTIKNGGELRELIPQEAARVLRYYNSHFGKYPYQEFDIVETYLTGGAMEYPQLIALGPKYYQLQRVLTHAIAHEAAHQWWYAAVGSDSYTHPWMDEGFAVYSTELYMSNAYKRLGYLEELIEEYKAAEAPAIPLDSPVTSFKTWTDYGNTAYKGGAVLLHSLREKAGDEAFYQIMKEYYESYRFKNAAPEDFIRIVRDIKGEETAEQIRKMIYEEK